MSLSVDAADLDAVEDSLEPPTDAPAFLLWLDARAEALREVRVRLEQDVAAEKLRRARWEERRAREESRARTLEEDMRRACEAMRHTLLPGATKSRVLPSGARVGFRRRTLRLTVQDADALLSWARTTGRTRTVDVPDMAACRAYFQETGTAPDGCDFAGGDEAFSVSTEGEE